MKLSHYQNITGEKGEDPKRKDSHYWNKGKWDHYIKPLLPTENRKDMAFIDIGANNGLFCKLAKDDGFRDVIGIEADEGAVMRGIAWRDKHKKLYDYGLHHREVGEDFDFDEMPVADVYLLSNVHYYFQLKDWLNFLDRLPTKTEYCLIITRPFAGGNRRDWRPLTSIEAVKYYFRDWELVRTRYKARQKHSEYKADQSPRVLHAMLFRSRLRRKRFDDLIPGAKADEVTINRKELVDNIVDGMRIEDTNYYKAWKARMYPKRWNKDELRLFVEHKILLLEDVIENGVEEPIIISPDHKTIDGKHRIAILESLGYESIITRMV